MRASFVSGLAVALFACGGRVDPSSTDGGAEPSGDAGEADAAVLPSSMLDASPSCAPSTQTFDWFPSRARTHPITRVAATRA